MADYKPDAAEPRPNFKTRRQDKEPRYLVSRNWLAGELAQACTSLRVGAEACIGSSSLHELGLRSCGQSDHNVCTETAIITQQAQYAQ